MPILVGNTVLALDTETTGMTPADGDRLVEVARVAVVDGVLGEEWSSLVNPSRAIPWGATRVHGITDAMVADAPAVAIVGSALRKACADLPLAFHNSPFDLPFLGQLLRDAGAPPLLNPIIDTLGLARGLFGTGDNNLRALAARLKLPAETWHRALGDTRTTARIFIELASRWEREKGIRSLMELAAVSQDVLRATRRAELRPPGMPARPPAPPPTESRREPVAAGAPASVAAAPGPPPAASGALPLDDFSRAREDALPPDLPLFSIPQESFPMVTQTVPEVGQMAPEFRLKGPGGAFYTLSEHRGQAPVVLVFYPLAFSRVCSHQLPELQKFIPQFEQAGAIVYGISVDSHHANAAFAKSLGLTFPLLSDWKHEASIAYGVMLPDAGYSARATFVVDRDGKIVWRELSESMGDQEQIPSPERALASLSGR
jgi:DNA polymerase III epsilon subunit family exonuclease